MKKNTLNKIVLLCLAVLCFSCKAKKEAATVVNTVPAEVSSKAESIKAITENNFAFKTLSAKAKIDFKLNNSSNGANLSLRIRKDEVIWMSITAIAGIEVARVMITPDSIKIYNRLQGEYLAKPFNFISQYSNPKIDFQTLQNLIIGNTIKGSVSPASEITIGSNQTVVKSSEDDIAYELLFNEYFKLIENRMQDIKGQQLVANYSEFQALNGRNLPYSVNLFSKAGNKNVRINIKYSSVSANEPVDFPFSVPKRFTVKD
ncbi:uncharacterized protein DUF4292 [Arcticibacter pallidicorallinus]|uniref:Uncharacterized protein DUF4292 n=1 Tax=Arcticibacter pallidicorallinus TaxID=1259464 RepID=A0A2T0U6U3_9SPHI|nr:DUF4292 domain-containing protein [Arcticibacter pallidicorallinus]PRY53636.1 uncharacterized protein DUF4292 [Arcticibacter pallidicorallinus]